MARRSATNERYQKYTGPAGKTRKSAAQAKPKRATGSPGKPSKSNKSSKSSAAREPLIINPPTAEYRRWRKIWWILLIAALVLTGGSWLIRVYVPGMEALAGIALGLGYGSIFAALYIDWTKLRRLRQEWMANGRPTAEKAAAQKAKAEKAAAKANASSTEDAADSSADNKS